MVTNTDTILESEEGIVSNEKTLQDKDLTQKSLARLAVESGHVTFVLQQRAFMQKLSRKNFKKNDKKSGRKKPRANDYDNDVVPVPDSEAVATEISSPPCSPVSLSPRTPKQLKTPTVKTPKRLRFADKQAYIRAISPRSTCPLTVKKRKLSMQTFSDKTPWVSGLTLEHKNKILTNTWLCSDIINTCTDIVQTQFPGISGFQATTLAPRFNENTKSWTQDFGTFQSKKAPCVQIQHTGKSHWVTSLQQTRDTTVHDLDSLNSLHTITASIEIQLAAIYGDKKKSFNVKIPEVQQQSNGNDCGLYDLANLMEFCVNQNVNPRLKIDYDEQSLRTHLVSCLEQGYLIEFPKMLDVSSDIHVKVHQRKIECIYLCGKPDLYEIMIGCEAKRVTCSKWAHQTCAGVSSDWFCDEHRQCI
ncbi:unnamed protein product [Mytilus coruscus]|uniref:Ubiquitin-like protease family profile domain-containing protein n=1 Tax=Mytilus coruscus TaxID=42192 RepID=A0A6J8A9K4_MYTCO|nr:unnamed protein product [Mytilus coruscus]